jgi:DNA polymerase III sliding clamp (beta) subunit (PCNA family)
VTGEGLDIAANGDYLLRILAKTPGDMVRLAFAGAQRQIVVMPAEGVLPEGWRATYVLMPLRDVD